METVVRPILGQLKIKLPVELECALNCGQGFKMIDILRAIVDATYKMTGEFDNNMEKLETFTKSLAEWYNNGINVEDTLDKNGNKISLLRVNGKAYELKEYTERVTTWSNLVVLDSGQRYEIENANGVSINVRPSYTMKKTVTSNGESATEVVTNPDGAVFSYEVSNPAIASVDANGNVKFLTLNSLTTERSITVTAIVTLHGESVSKDITVYQKPTGTTVVYTSYAWMQDGVPSTIIKNNAKVLGASSETLSVSSALADQKNCLCIAIPNSAPYTVQSILDAGGDVPDWNSTILEGYDVYYVKSDRGYIVDTLTIKIYK